MDSVNTYSQYSTCYRLFQRCYRDQTISRGEAGPIYLIPRFETKPLRDGCNTTLITWKRFILFTPCSEPLLWKVQHLQLSTTSKVRLLGWCGSLLAVDLSSYAIIANVLVCSGPERMALYDGRGTHHVQNPSRPSPPAFHTAKAGREGLGTRLDLSQFVLGPELLACSIVSAYSVYSTDLSVLPLHGAQLVLGPALNGSTTVLTFLVPLPWGMRLSQVPDVHHFVMSSCNQQGDYQYQWLCIAPHPENYNVGQIPCVCVCVCVCVCAGAAPPVRLVRLWPDHFSSRLDFNITCSVVTHNLR